MRTVFRDDRNFVLSCLLVLFAMAVALPAYAAIVQIDLDGDPSNGDESTVETKVLQSFPVKIENVVFNNTLGMSFTFDWFGAGPGGFSSLLTPGPDVGTKWAWSTVSQVYSITTVGSFFEVRQCVVEDLGELDKATLDGLLSQPQDCLFSPTQSLLGFQTTIETVPGDLAASLDQSPSYRTLLDDLDVGVQSPQVGQIQIEAGQIGNSPDRVQTILLLETGLKCS